jgi:ADP-heptose:LPS heptosyltransferase
MSNGECRMNDPTNQTSTFDIRHSTFVIPLVAGIGNALMAEPMVRRLRDGRPEARIVVMAISEPIAEVMRRVRGVEVVVTGSGLKKLLRGAQATRKLKPDVYLVPFPSNRWQYNLLAKASGARRVILHGYPIGKWSALGCLHRDRVPAQRGLHDVEQNLRLLSPLGLDSADADAPRFELNDEDRARAADLLREAGIDESFVIIHAGSARTVLAEAKRWPAENYAKLAEAIRDESRRPVVIVEGPDEAGVADAILRRVGDRSRIHALALRGNLGVAGAVLERAAFYVGTDSGLAHLSAAVGRRAITLFAPADPDRVCPFGNRDLVIQPPGLSEPLFLYPWKSTRPKLPPGAEEWIKRISVEQAMQKARGLFPLPCTHGRGLE